ncbi:hypothetical protein PIROE2DRAFT_8006 [Piromyces sp. E2]|nr:hypothetical protein PIROE2DRAFT_8006 [Piromyces sp. E2]|eukprot:OUM65031.1 hypothetical protein PIROE2DRAFT_8006 [Piromyces sp. E2]
MDYENSYKNINFLTSEEKQILYFLREVNKGHIKYKVKKIFEEMKRYKYSEEEAITIINNIMLATNNLPYARTNLHTLCDNNEYHINFRANECIKKELEERFDNLSINDKESASKYKIIYYDVLKKYFG